MTFTPYINPYQKFDALQLMKIIIDLEYALAGQESLIAISLKGAIKSNTPAQVIISTCKDMIKDNENEMGFILGNNLLNQIKNHQ